MTEERFIIIPRSELSSVSMYPGRDPRVNVNFVQLYPKVAKSKHVVPSQLFCGEEETERGVKFQGPKLEDKQSRSLHHCSISGVFQQQTEFSVLWTRQWKMDCPAIHTPASVIPFLLRIWNKTIPSRRRKKNYLPSPDCSLETFAHVTRENMKWSWGVLQIEKVKKALESPPRKGKQPKRKRPPRTDEGPDTCL